MRTDSPSQKGVPASFHPSRHSLQRRIRQSDDEKSVQPAKSLQTTTSLLVFLLPPVPPVPSVPLPQSWVFVPLHSCRNRGLLSTSVQGRPDASADLCIPA